MKINPFIIFILLSLVTNNAKADFTGIDLTETIIPSAGYRFGERRTFEFGLGYGGSLFNEEYFGGHFIGKAGLEFDQEHTMYAPKLGFEANLLFISARLLLVYQITKDKNSLDFIPEVGVCLGSYVNCMIRFTGLDDKGYPTFSANALQLNLNIPISTENLSTLWKKK